MDYPKVDPDSLKLPPCPLPRPEEEVCWFVDSRFVTGIYRGHDKNGQPLIINQFGNPAFIRTFDAVRLTKPFDRRKPNWAYLPKDGVVVRPPDDVRKTFNVLLDQRIPPGPKYIDLISEIWGRGFEVYVVGGTVRDVLGNDPSKDVDIVTTMPLNHMRRFLRSMYRYDPSGKDSRGFIRIGGTPESGDPFIDLKVFSDSLPGTTQACFGVGFERDVAHRDFACNALYYDPINAVLLDPSGHGIEDALANRLRLICDSADLTRSLG